MSRNPIDPAKQIQNMNTPNLLAELYQILAAHGASEAVLDQVLAASQGEPLPHETLQPYAPESADQHPDDAAVDRFAAAMKAKLAAGRVKGRGGWDDPAQCSVESLAAMLVSHLNKGNAGTFEDVANFAMMLHQRGADPRILADVVTPAPAAQEPVIGWAFHNPDSGWEWHEDHPVKSGMAEDATSIRRMTLQQFRERYGCADTSPPAAEQPDTARAILTDEDMRRLRRFQEICDDSDAGGHDLPKEAVKRLERAGALRSCGFGRHEVTLFGDYLLSKEEV